MLAKTAIDTVINPRLECVTRPGIQELDESVGRPPQHRDFVMVILSGIRKAAVRTLPAAAFSLLLPFQLQAQSQYFSPVLLDQAERVDQSSEAFPWIYMGNGTREVARTAFASTRTARSSSPTR